MSSACLDLHDAVLAIDLSHQVDGAGVAQLGMGSESLARIFDSWADSVAVDPTVQYLQIIKMSAVLGPLSDSSPFAQGTVYRSPAPSALGRLDSGSSLC